MRPGRQGLPPPRHNLKTLALLIGLLATTAACATTEGHEGASASKPEVSEQSILESTDRALADGRFEDASYFLNRVLSKNPNNAAARLRLAELYLATGQKAAASQVFKSLTATKDLSARAHQGWGIAMLRRGELTTAHEALRRAIEENPKLWRSWNALGLYYDTQDRWPDAQKAYDKALELKPDSAMIHNNVGYSLLIQKKFVGATMKFTKALKLDSKFAMARTNLRLALSWLGRYDEAMMGVPVGELPTALNDVGYVAMLRGDYAQAEALLAQALETSPRFNEKAWRNLKYIESVRKTNMRSRPRRKKW